MDKIVIIGANSFQNPLILKAKEMGYETHVFAWACGDIGEKTADYFYPISIVEKEQILEECKKIKPKAVVTIASDLATLTVNYVSNKLGLSSNNPKYTEICTNKYAMRNAFEKAGVRVPKYINIGLNEKIDLTDFKFPIIVKPTDRSGSRGITKVEKIEDIDNAIKKAIENSFEKRAIIEEFIGGREYSCECITFNGKHHFFTITKKYTTGAPNFIETGHIQPSDLSDEKIEEVKAEIFKALDALHITCGASHSEFKVDEDGVVRIIEIGARMGGDCIGSDLVKISTGYDFLKLTIEAALGNEPKIERVSEPKIAKINFIFSKEDYRKLKKIKENYPKCIYYESEISDFEHKIVDSSSRYGYYILQCKDMEELEKIENM